jgi:hypothetical protein
MRDIDIGDMSLEEEALLELRTLSKACVSMAENIATIADAIRRAANTVEAESDLQEQEDQAGS